VVKLTKIYTRTGDTGTTGLVDGSRVAKSDPRIAAIGDVDEANSVLGLALIHVPEGFVHEELARIQNDLFDLGADLATPGTIEGALRIVPGQVERLEQAIDTLNADLSPLTSFILPGGDAGAAGLHLVRAVVRRAERSVTAMPDASSAAATYINRLSDYLFVAARVLNQSGAGDVLWVPGGTR
jgi:cob(I)alamin adenosyltransferase